MAPRPRLPIARPMKTEPRKTTPRPVPRNYAALKFKGATPSVDFDWDAALYRYAVTMRGLGYTLTEEQQKRIDDHDALQD